MSTHNMFSWSNMKKYQYFSVEKKRPYQAQCFCTKTWFVVLIRSTLATLVLTTCVHGKNYLYIPVEKIT